MTTGKLIAYTCGALALTQGALCLVFIKWVF